MAEIEHADETRSVQYKMSDVSESNKLEKFVEDVRYYFICPSTVPPHLYVCPPPGKFCGCFFLFL